MCDKFDVGICIDGVLDSRSIHILFTDDLRRHIQERGMERNQSWYQMRLCHRVLLATIGFNNILDSLHRYDFHLHKDFSESQATCCTVEAN